MRPNPDRGNIYLTTGYYLLLQKIFNIEISHRNLKCLLYLFKTFDGYKYQFSSKIKRIQQIFKCFSVKCVSSD